MKFRKSIIALLIVVFLFTFLACSKREEDTKNGVTIHFDLQCDDGTVYPTSIEDIYIDGTKEMHMPQDPFRIGFTFEGWFYEKEGLNRFSTKEGITEDITLFAKWKKNKAGGSDVKPEEEITEDEIGFKYKIISDTEVAIEKYNGDVKNIQIQSKFGNRNITKILSSAFYGNDIIETVSIPKNIVEIENKAFGNCKKLTSINVDVNNTIFSSLNGVLFNKSKTNIICVGAGRTDDFIINNTITEIKPYAFSGVKTKITFEEKTKISQLSGFVFSESVGDIYLPKEIEILQKAFVNSYSSIIFGNDSEIEMIYPMAFESYKAKKLVLPSSITLINKAAFKDCEAIVDLSQTSLTTITESAFANYKGSSITIPKNIVDIEKNAFDNSNTTINFENNSKYSVIKASAFKNFNGVINIPTSVTKIKENAFINAHATINFNENSPLDLVEKNGIPNTCTITPDKYKDLYIH